LWQTTYQRGARDALENVKLVATGCRHANLAHHLISLFRHDRRKALEDLRPRNVRQVV